MSPTILYIRGWRLFFYSNERDEPMHIHARKGDAECKYWLRAELYEIDEVYSYNLTPALRREIRRIIFLHFEELVEAWERGWEQ
ncbi:MAG TPA: DUF4160 domain-containing protein [Bacteroidetes bacterium]|nr:DUF4160 domain-containing protein [Bacteroidota bacterium]